MADMSALAQSSGTLSRVLLTAFIAGGIVCAAWGAQAAEEASTLEYQVKAAFLYKFAGYVDWPSTSFARPDTPVTIAVTVKRVKGGESLAGVHILFVGKAESARLSQWMQSARPHSVLTVTESDGALAHGSVINFVMTDRRVRFEVALDSAEKSKLKLSSRLLAVAQQVHTGTP
jgi:YfiR/HmsC-like